MTFSPLQVRLYINALILISIAAYFFLIPITMLVRDIHHPSLANGEMPRFSYRWHRTLTTDFASWAQARTAAGTAATLDVHDISGTEWPMFSAVFYLWATEALQEASLQRTAPAPVQYSLPAIEAAAELIVDPNNAAWVKRHWGEDYLTEENIFYRMLLISGLTSYQKLSGNNQHQKLLAQQVESLAAEITRSEYGLLDDYPNQCYPIDVLPAIAAISRADDILGTDHTEFVSNSLRGFTGPLLDPATQLPAYIALSKRGVGSGPARGVGIAYMLIWAPELWPTVADQWYERYDNHFWQESFLTASVREFSKESDYPDWLVDVDAGPVFSGIGTAASAFGIGAARANGRNDQAYLLGAQAMVAAWPLPNGTLLIPRLLSNLSDAPHVGEAALLFSFTRMPAGSGEPKEKPSLPLSVYLGLLVYLALGVVLLREGFRRVTFSHRSQLQEATRFYKTQTALWVALIATGTILFVQGEPLTATLVFFIASMFPRTTRTASK